MFFLFLADAVWKPFDVSTLLMLKMIVLIVCDGVWVCKNRQHMLVELYVHTCFERLAVFFYYFWLFLTFFIIRLSSVSPGPT